MQTIIEKDGEGYLAKVKGHPNLFAFAYSEVDAITELKNVVEMVMDYHLEQVNSERIIKNELTSMQEKHTIQV
jgi:predicted RNase H-like HicB family nuclease